MPTKQDYYNQGRRDALAFQADPATYIAQAPKQGQWQRRAYDEGWTSAQAEKLAQVPVEAPPGKRIDLERLLALTAGWKSGRVEHLKVLALDHNTEKRDARRVRLYKAIGRLLDRHGIPTAIPLN